MSGAVPAPPSRRLSRRLSRRGFKWQLPTSADDCPGFELHPNFGTLGRCKNCTRARNDHSAEKQMNLERAHWQRLPLFMDKQSNRNPSFVGHRDLHSNPFMFKGVAAVSALSRRSRRAMGSLGQKSLTKVLGLPGELGSSFDSASTSTNSSRNLSLDDQSEGSNSRSSNDEGSASDSRIGQTDGRQRSRLSLPRGRRRRSRQDRSGSSNSSVSQTSDAVSVPATGVEEDVTAAKTDVVVDVDSESDSASWRSSSPGCEGQEEVTEQEEVPSEPDGEVCGTSSEEDNEPASLIVLADEQVHTNATDVVDSDSDTDSDAASVSQVEEGGDEGGNEDCDDDIVEQQHVDEQHVGDDGRLRVAHTQRENSGVTSVWKQTSYGWTRVQVAAPKPHHRQAVSPWRRPRPVSFVTQSETTKQQAGVASKHGGWTFGLTLQDERDEVVTAYIGAEYDSSSDDESQPASDMGCKHDSAYDGESDSGSSSSSDSSSSADEEEGASDRELSSDESSDSDSDDAGGVALMASIAEKRLRFRSSSGDSSNSNSLSSSGDGDDGESQTEEPMRRNEQGTSGVSVADSSDEGESGGASGNESGNNSSNSSENESGSSEGSGDSDDSMVSSSEHRESDEPAWDDWLANRPSIDGSASATAATATPSTKVIGSAAAAIGSTDSRTEMVDPTTALLLHAERFMDGNERVIPSQEERERVEELRRQAEEDSSDGMQVVLVKFDRECQPAPAFLLAFDPQEETYTVQWEGGVLQSNVSKDDIFFEVDPVDKAIFLEVCDVTGAERRKRRRKRKQWLQTRGYSFDDGTTDDVTEVLESTRESVDETENPARRYAMFMPEVHQGSLWVAARLGDLGAVRFFVESCGQEVNEVQQVGPGDTGRTALFYACMYGHVNVVRWLLETGAEDVDGSALGAAQGRADVLALLARFGQAGKKGPDPEADAVVAALARALSRFPDDDDDEEEEEEEYDDDQSTTSVEARTKDSSSSNSSSSGSSSSSSSNSVKFKPLHRPSILKRPSLHASSKSLRGSSGNTRLARSNGRRQSEPPPRSVTVNKRALVFMYNGDRSARLQSLCTDNPNTDVAVVQREARAGSDCSHESYLAEVDLPETDEEEEEEEEEVDHAARASAEFEYAVSVGGVEVNGDEGAYHSDEVDNYAHNRAVTPTNQMSSSDGNTSGRSDEGVTEESKSELDSISDKQSSDEDSQDKPTSLKRTDTLRDKSLDKVLRATKPASSASSSSKRDTKSGGLLESQSGWL